MKIMCGKTMSNLVVENMEDIWIGLSYKQEPCCHDI